MHTCDTETHKLEIAVLKIVNYRLAAAFQHIYVHVVVYMCNRYVCMHIHLYSNTNVATAFSKIIF